MTLDPAAASYLNARSQFIRQTGRDPSDPFDRSFGFHHEGLYQQRLSPGIPVQDPPVLAIRSSSSTVALRSFQAAHAALGRQTQEDLHLAQMVHAYLQYEFQLEAGVDRQGDSSDLQVREEHRGG